MKLPKNVFPPVSLSPEQCTAYEKLSDDVVNQALHEYDDFNVTRGRQLDRKRWKQIRKCDDITVYCERASYINSKASSSSASASYSSGSPSSRSRSGNHASGGAGVRASELDLSDSEDDFRSESAINSPVSKLSTAAVSSILENEVISTSKKERAALPKILAVGRVPGKVEDMIYGIITPTLTHTFMKSAYINDEIADAKVLHMIKHATPDDPLRFLGLKWIIKAHSKVIGTVVRQRDFVFVESLGMRTRADGSRFGYFVMHSVEVPECGELKDYSIVRGRLSLVYILTQSTHGQVDVFMKSYVELNGTLPDSIGVRTAANSLMTVALTNICGHKRKMGWAVTKKLRTPPRNPPMLSAESNCSNCNKSFSRISSGAACFFCATRVCSKCCEQREVTIANLHAKATKSSSSSAKLTMKMSPNTCTRCYSTVFRSMEAEDVAREEVLAGEYGVVPRDYGKAKPQQSGAPLSTSSSLDIARDLQSLTLAEKRSGSGVASRSTAASAKDQLRRDSVIELDRGDFVQGSGTPYQPGVVALPHMMAYQGHPGSVYLEQPTAAFHGAPQHAGYGAPPPVPLHMAYGGQPPMGYDAHHSMGYGGAPQPPPHMMYSNQPPVNYGVPPPSQPTDADLYARITKLHQTAEHVYQYTKRTTDNAMICSRCTVKKKIVIEATEKRVVLKPFMFCIVCTIRAKNFSALQVQIEELRERQVAI